MSFKLEPFYTPSSAPSVKYKMFNTQPTQKETTMKNNNQANFTVELGKTYIDMKGNKVKITDTFTWTNTTEKLFTGNVNGVCYTRGGLCFRHLMGVVSISNQHNLVEEYVEHKPKPLKIEVGKSYIAANDDIVKIEKETIHHTFRGDKKGIFYNHLGFATCISQTKFRCVEEYNLVKEYVTTTDTEDSEGCINLTLTNDQFVALHAILNYVRLGTPDTPKINPYRAAISQLMIDISDMEYEYELDIEEATSDIYITASNDEGPVIEFRNRK